MRYLSRGLVQVAGLLVVSITLFGAASHLAAQPTRINVTLVRTLFVREWGVPHVIGVAYANKVGHIHLVSQAVERDAHTQTTTVVTITPYEEFVSETTLSFAIADSYTNPGASIISETGAISNTDTYGSIHGLNIAFDDAHERLLLYDTVGHRLASVNQDKTGLLAPNTMTIVDTSALPLQHVDGIAVAQQPARLFFLDSAQQRITSVMLDHSLTLSPTTMMTITLEPLASNALRGLAIHPNTQQLYVGDIEQKSLHVLSQAGEFIATYRLADLALMTPGGFVFSPSADLTDAPSDLELLLADSNLPIIADFAASHHAVTGQADTARSSLLARSYLPSILRAVVSQQTTNAPSTSNSHTSNVQTGSTDEPLPGRLLVLALAPLPDKEIIPGTPELDSALATPSIKRTVPPVDPILTGPQSHGETTK